MGTCLPELPLATLLLPIQIQRRAENVMKISGYVPRVFSAAVRFLLICGDCRLAALKAYAVVAPFPVSSPLARSAVLLTNSIV